MAIESAWLGRRLFSEAESLQIAHREAILAEEASDVLWFTEHEPVYVIGRRTPPQDDLPGREWLRASGIPVVHARRGGLVTYHGPGQLVMYCMLDIKKRGITIPCLVAALEEAVIHWLKGLSVNGVRREGAPGVWVAEEKICSIGLHFRRWVSMYGLSLNLGPELGPFQHIRPCGYSGGDVTSVAKLLGSSPDPADAWEERCCGHKYVH